MSTLLVSPTLLGRASDNLARRVASSTRWHTDDQAEHVAQASVNRLHSSFPELDDYSEDRLHVTFWRRFYALRGSA